MNDNSPLIQTYIINDCLFDSGAQSDNYISQTYVDSYIDVFRDYIIDHKSTVRLGDSLTTVDITQIITLYVSFLDNAAITHYATLNFSIMHMKNIDMIIGISSILYSFYDLFLDMLKTARNILLKTTPIPVPLTINHGGLSTIYTDMFSTDLDPPSLSAIEDAIDIVLPKEYQASYDHVDTSSAIPHHPDYIGCEPTWFSPEIAPCPEEDDVPEPCSFTLPLNFLGIPRQEVLDTYHALLLTNINPELVRNQPEVLTFMKGPIALSVFCPETWTGIKGIPPLKLEFDTRLPPRLKTAVRTVRPILLNPAYIEFLRLRKYMYVISISNITSPLVIAPKPGSPQGVRFCGDYTVVNTYMPFRQAYIPIVLHELNKAARGTYFIDFDMRTAFHQVPLDEATSNNLSILTPWGNIRPLFMPEGISSASGILNSIMTDIFEPESKSAIVIFDNFLVIAQSFRDCYEKLVRFLTICAERNVILGMNKSKIGYPEATFFGYLVKDNTYSMTESRKKSITSLAMPTTLKQVQSFLGATIFFSNNLPGYAEYAAPINEMTTKNFSFDKTTWQKDYEAFFESFKEALLASIAVTFPDYTLTFILRTDASKDAWGAVLLQITPTGTYQCIGLASKKWSVAATRWDIGKKEACAMYMGVRALEYTLRGKYFIHETDNKNLLFYKENTTAIVIRWRIYMASFLSCTRFLLAKYNSISDWLTRQYRLYYLTRDTVLDDTDLHLCSVSTATISRSDFTDHLLALLVHSNPSDTESEVNHSPTSKVLSLQQMFAYVHGGRKFHRGIRATKEKLDQIFTGNAIPVRIVGELISECTTCQKVREKLGYSLPSENLHLKPPSVRSRIGFDVLTITPRDKYGNSYLQVCTEHFTKFMSLYPSSDKSADSAARAMFQHYVTYGQFDQVITDPGSDYMSGTIVLLNQFLGQEKLVTLVDVHTGIGVEPTNKKVKNFLQTLTHDLRLRDIWSDPIILGLIAHACNSQRHGETGMVPMELKFGSADFSRMFLPDNDIISADAPDILILFNTHLKTIRDISRSFQLSLVEERDNSNSHPSTLNKYQPGDFVLFLYSVKGDQEHKLDSKHLGPFKVVSHIRNDVTVRNIITDAIKVFHANRLKYFFGSADQAKDAAIRDMDQYLVDSITAYRGDPLVRTSMSFLVQFKDNTMQWVLWSRDLFDTVQYEAYCRSLPQLFPLVVLHKEALELMKILNRTPITVVESGQTAYLDIRAIGAGWFQGLDLPDSDHTTYVVPLLYQNSTSKGTRLSCIIPSLKIVWAGRNAVNHTFVKMWGSQVILTDKMTLITLDLIRHYKLIEKLT